MGKANADISDEVLVVAAILGDLGAFNELVLRYRPAVVRVAQTVVGCRDAEDVAQDALLLAFKALPSIENPEKFGPWLLTITRNRALRFSRQKHLKQGGEVELDEWLLERLTALNRPLIDRRDTDEEIRLAMANLPGDYALVLALRFFDEMPLKRIAASLNLPLSTIKWRIHRGKKLLREQINNLRIGERHGPRKRANQTG